MFHFKKRPLNFSPFSVSHMWQNSLDVDGCGDLDVDGRLDGDVRGEDISSRFSKSKIESSAIISST